MGERDGEKTQKKEVNHLMRECFFFTANSSCKFLFVSSHLVGGYICPSMVSYVQPRRARNTEGLWKVVLNLRERYKGLDYRQTVRMEQCM